MIHDEVSLKHYIFIHGQLLSIFYICEYETEYAHKKREPDMVQALVQTVLSNDGSWCSNDHPVGHSHKIKTPPPESLRSPSSPPVIWGCWYTALGTDTAHMSSRLTKLVNRPSFAFRVHVTCMPKNATHSTLGWWCLVHTLYVRCTLW